MGDDTKTTESEETQSTRKKVFVIKAKQNGLKSAENFLKNRSWDIVSSHEMKVALAALFRTKFDYALIGVDHAHGHVLKLPDIVTQTLKIPIVLYAESMTPQAAHMLRTTRNPYVLFPPVSGPAIERMLLRIEKDRAAQSAQKANDLRMTDSSNADSGAIRISEGGNGNGGMAESAQMHGSFSEEDIAKLFEGEGLSPMLGATQDGLSSASMVQYQKSASAHTLMEQEDALPSDLMSQLTQQPQANSANGINHSHPRSSSVDDINHGSYSTSQGAASNTSFDSTQYQKGASGHSLTEQEEGSDSSTMSEMQRAQMSAGQNGFSPFPPGSNIDPSLWPADAKPSTGGHMDSSSAHGDYSTSHASSEEYRRQVEHHSLLMNGTVHALAKASAHSPATVPVAIAPTMSSNVACFDIDAAGMSGMIVCAYGNDRVIDKKFSDDLRTHLLHYMQSNGIDFKIEDVVNLNVQQVAFEEWSAKEALFLRKSIHAGCELALGFFINSAPQARLEPSERNDMLKVNIDEIRTDHSLGFDVFLYFPENDKYLRYVGKDGNLSGKQWDRLTASGITEFHVKKEAVSEISRYRMKNFLNDKISEFQNSFQNGKKSA